MLPNNCAQQQRNYSSYGQISEGLKIHSRDTSNSRKIYEIGTKFQKPPPGLNGTSGASLPPEVCGKTIANHIYIKYRSQNLSLQTPFSHLVGA